ncbi:hypothetical protein V1509DRAFT_611689 [Lipomyces kononenkoae]
MRVRLVKKKLQRFETAHVTVAAWMDYSLGAFDRVSNLTRDWQVGDIVIMGGESRFAWHGIGRVWDKTAPDYLAGFDYYEHVENGRIPASVASGRKRYSSKTVSWEWKRAVVI